MQLYQLKFGAAIKLQQLLLKLNNAPKRWSLIDGKKFFKTRWNLLIIDVSIPNLSNIAGFQITGNCFIKLNV